jgi:dipeptidyl aminopeptidase/acylaminoacyl peptidase
MRRILLALIGAALLTATGQAAAQEANTDYLEKLPPLIERELFFGDPEIASASISPDGRYITFRKPYKDVMNIWVKGVDEPFDAARPLTADTERPVSGYFWSQDSRVVLYVQDKGGNENYHIYAVDPTAAPEPETGVPPALNLTPYGSIQARIFSVPEATPDKMIVGINDRDLQVHDVYRIDLNTGERELVLENSESVAGWSTDLAGNVRLGVKIGSDGGTQILRVDRAALTEVYSCSNEESCGPVRFHPDGERVYMVTNKGDDVDLARLILFNPETGAEEFVESDPEKRVDFGGAEFSDVTDEIIATYYVGDTIRIYPKTKEAEHDLELLRNKLPEGAISLGSSTEDESLVIVRVARDVDPGSTYLYNRETGDVASDHLAFMKPVRFKARDGLEIPAYLTLPRGAVPGDLPVIILPHGGPWARDIWGYDPYTQFLANRGYAVLQPNFRGSTGYGKTFLNAGNKEWGTGAMQHDITDAVQYLIDEGVADPNRVGIFGGSYGGYATLAGVAFTPEVYAAGISYVGPSNLITLLESIPPYWAPIRNMFAVRLGDESEQIVVALRDLGREVEYMLAEDEGHGFAGRENRLAIAVAMETFFAKHLFGRYQEEMPAPIAERLAALTVDVGTVTLAEMTLAEAEVWVKPLPYTDGGVIEAGTWEYTIKLQTMGQEIEIAGTRTIEASSIVDRAVWRVIDVSVLPMGTMTDTLELDKATLAPVRRGVGGMATVGLEYTEATVTGEMVAMGQTAPIDVELEAPVFADGSGLEVSLAGIPLAVGYETTLRTFDAERQKVRPFKVSVTGSETTECPAGTFDTFVVELVPLDGDEAGTSTFHVMKDAPHHVVLREFRLPAQMGSGTGTKELTSVGSGSTN